MDNLPSLTTIFKDLPQLHIIDIGSNPHQIHKPVYAGLLSAGQARITGFEPGDKAFAKLQASKGAYETYYPYAIGDGTTQPFYECAASVMSSLYAPNHDLLRHFHLLNEAAQVVQTHTMETKRLDDVPGIAACDYLQMDVQGAELQCLQGGDAIVKETLVIQAETNLLPMYKGQPLFSEVELHLRQRGFMLHRLDSLQTRTWKPLCLNKSLFEGWAQWVWGDAVFIRDIATWKDLSAEALLKMAFVMHDIFRACDLVQLILLERDRIHGTADGMAYLDWLAQHVPQLVTKPDLPNGMSFA